MQRPLVTHAWFASGFASWCLSLCLLALCACKRDAEPAAHSEALHEQAPDKADMPTLEPSALASELQAGTDKPLLLHVGFKKLYEQAHIPGSEYYGAGSDDDAIERIRKRFAELPRDTRIVIYCGCCPWVRCPNVKPAYAALHALGFTHAQVLMIPEDFGTDWVSKGYPVEKST